MGQRQIRVGELIKRELSQLLHSRWQKESVAITLTGVDVSPDLSRARVYYSAFGGRDNSARAGKFLMSVRGRLRMMLGKNVGVKRTPELEFVYDRSIERGAHLMEIFGELDAEESAKGAGDAEPKSD